MTELTQEQKKLHKAYSDGAAMAYRDCAVILRKIIGAAPSAELKELAEMFSPIADSCDAKAMRVYAEVETLAKAIRQ